ncbi:MAG TPA: LysR substrate-binding domain-containing protein [Phenylobacterium sp.]|jgi:LysR family glycine cleavage system transcriptional activator|uniref:LysR substrate-binding domain-containing protein n=1 Tax=Phenylobacterium sp. TaxID=1871053 RepID=UPI002B55CC6D|nr:LysR substrate-binding domain-containing protein [Phenylobacterium sp.]HXA40622.1 LysR substrate-binding domain-containing protein [Phenylobacterium sp.]
MAKRSQLPLTALRAFEAFARLGKMSLAADELCVTHGAVSRQVRSLEALCGVKLTQGPRNALKLTDAGERLARSLGRTFDELEQSFREVKAAADRELHVSCVGTLAMKWLIPRLSGFHARHPDLSIRVTEAYGPVDFTREPFDAAIRLTESVVGEGLTATPFLDNFHGPVVAPPLAAGGLDLARTPRLHTRPHRQAWAEWSDHAGVPVPEPPENREYEHLFYMLEAAVAGLGVGLSPWIYVANDIAAGRLAAPFGFTATPAKFHLILPGQPPKRGLKAFREWLIEEAATAPAPPVLADAAA